MKHSVTRYSATASIPIAGPFSGTCTVCHDTPNAGDHSIPMPLNIGLTDESRRTPDLPLYYIKNNTTRQTVKTRREEADLVAFLSAL